MSIVLPALAVAIAAFCVWLAVRIFNRRERWAKWTAAGALFGVSVLYALSFGPACWWLSPPDEIGEQPTAPAIYVPIGWLYREGGCLESGIAWYATILHPDDILLPCGPSEFTGVDFVWIKR